MGYTGFLAAGNFSRARPRGVRRGAATKTARSRPYGKRGIDHAASLTLFLVFCKRLLTLVAIPIGLFVRGAAPAVMAGLDPAIHESTVISGFNRLKINDYHLLVTLMAKRRGVGWPARGRP